MSCMCFLTDLELKTVFIEKLTWHFNWISQESNIPFLDLRCLTSSKNWNTWLCEVLSIYHKILIWNISLCILGSLRYFINMRYIEVASRWAVSYFKLFHKIFDAQNIEGRGKSWSRFLQASTKVIYCIFIY